MNHELLDVQAGFRKGRGPHAKNWLIGKDWCWEGLVAGGEGDDRGWDGWKASPTWWTWVWVNSGVGDGQGGLVCCNSWGYKESARLSYWTELNWWNIVMILFFTFLLLLCATTLFDWGSGSKKSAYNAGDPGSIQGSGRSLLRKWLATPVFLPEWLPSPVFLPREFHGQRSLASLSARQDWLTFTFTGWQYLLEVSLFYKPLSV